MLIIRKAQMDAFAAAALTERVCDHVKEFFPERCASFSSQDLRQFVATGIKKAALYGFNASPEVCQYVDLMFLLGDEFDTDPSLRWAANLLRKGGYTPELRMDLLFGAAIEHLEQKEA